MSEIKEKLIHQKKAFVPKENACYEAPIVSILPSSLVYYRNSFTGLLHRTLFTVWGVEVSIGALFFVILALGSIIGVEVWAYTNNTHRHYSGLCTAYTILSLFVLSSRNSIWVFLTGISIERSIQLHKFTGFVVVFVAFLHFYINFDFRFVKKTGIYMLIIVSYMFIISFFWFRRANYDLFIKLHILGALPFPYFAYKHGATPIIVGFGLWVLDLLIRFIVVINNQRKLSTAQIEEKDGIIRLTMKKRQFKHKAGQHVEVWIPRVSIFSLHPFTISSAPHESDLTLHIKPLGSYTRYLHKLAKKQSTVRIAVEGPYGNPSINLNNTKYKLFMLVTGGIGVTPIKSILNNLCDQIDRGREVKNIRFIWSVRNVSLVNSVFEKGKDLFYGFKDKISSKVFVTRKQAEDEESMLNQEIDGFIRNDGRPDLAKEFSEMAKLCKELNENKVAVVCCGPKSLSSAVSKLVRENSKNSVSFDLHTEIFEF